MNKLKNTLLVFLLLIILPITVKADCQSDFKAIEDQFKVTYTYDINTDEYTITLINPNYSIYSYLIDEELEKAKKITDNNQMTIILEHYKGEKYTYSIYGITGNCKLVELKKENLELKRYNKYAESDACKGNEEFALCQKDYDKPITNETFESRLETYKQTKEQENSNTEEEKTDEPQKQNKTDNIIETVLNYIKKNLIQVIAATVFAILLIVTIILSIKSAVKSRRLE